LIVLGHPSNTSFSAALAESYAQGARAAGHTVRMLRLADLQFDPVLHASNTHAQPLESALLQAQSDIEWAQHIGWVFPVWWGSLPALLKGFLDRTLTPGFAYKFQKGSSYPQQLLSGRTAHLLVPMDTPPWYFRWVYRMPAIHQMTKTTLGFCGIRTTRIRMMGPVIHSTPVQRAKWLEQAMRQGQGL
jgi:putative NADPH-quinone reductase